MRLAQSPLRPDFVWQKMGNEPFNGLELLLGDGKTANLREQEKIAIDYMKEHREDLRFLASFPGVGACPRRARRPRAGVEPARPLKAAGSDAAISTGALYASAMDLAFLNRFAGNSDAPAAAAADADAALQRLTAIAAEDQQEIDQVRTQYHLLGAHLPNVHPTRTLQSASARPGSIPILAQPPCSCSFPTVRRVLSAF